MTLRERLKPPPLPPLPAAKPPRPRREVQELAIGSPTISVELYGKLAGINNHVIRRFVTTFPRPGRQWGGPDVDAMRIMMASALEAAADAALKSVTAVTIPDIPRDTSMAPFPDDEITAPMGRHQKPHG